MSDQNPPRSADSDPSAAPGGADGGVKSPTDKPDPLPGTERKARNPVKRMKEVVDNSLRETTRVDSTEAVKDRPAPSTEGHGQAAAVDAADSAVDVVRDGARKDLRDSAEAVDQLAGKVDTERALADAAKHADELDRIEDEFGTEAFEIAVTVATNKEAETSEAHSALVRKAAKAASEAPGNVRRARAAAALDDVDEVDSPHGMHALRVDPIRAVDHAFIGDNNVPAVSFGPEDSGAVYGQHNPLARSVIRGLSGDDEAKVRIVAESESKGAANLDEERREHNKEAREVNARTVAADEAPRRRNR